MVMIKLFAFTSSVKLKQPKEREREERKNSIWKAVRVTVW